MIPVGASVLIGRPGSRLNGYAGTVADGILADDGEVWVQPASVDPEGPVLVPVGSVVEADQNGNPVWRAGLDQAVGMAAHPSMAAKQTGELERKIAELREEQRVARTLAAGGADGRRYRGMLAERIAAFEIALLWRGRRP